MVIQLRRVKSEAQKEWASQFPEEKTTTLPEWDLESEASTEPFLADDGTALHVPKSFPPSTSRRCLLRRC